MDKLETKDSEYTWSIASSKGVLQSTTLPKTLRTFEDFAKADVYTGDIDPTYWVMNKGYYSKGSHWASRFCVAMLCYYHMGTAEKAASFEGQDFWDYIESVFPTAPRASERRHFRAANGTNALRSMKALSPTPEAFFEQFPQTYEGVRSICERKLVQFGPYFQLKICDYMDRCLDIPIRSYQGLANNLPGFPLKAASMLYPGIPSFVAFHNTVERIGQLNLLAPPKFDRPLGPAEVETILCDWKRAKTGSSWVGADVLDKYEAIPEGSELREWLPALVKRHTFKLELE